MKVLITTIADQTLARRMTKLPPVELRPVFFAGSFSVGFGTRPLPNAHVRPQHFHQNGGQVMHFLNPAITALLIVQRPERSPQFMLLFESSGDGVHVTYPSVGIRLFRRLKHPDHQGVLPAAGIEARTHELLDGINVHGVQLADGLPPCISPQPNLPQRAIDAAKQLLRRQHVVEPAPADVEPAARRATNKPAMIRLTITKADEGIPRPASSSRRSMSA